MYEPPKSMKPMRKKTREWKFHDWELLARKRGGHDEVVNRLKEFIEKKYSVEVSRDFTEQELEQFWIAFNERSNRHHAIFVPDLIVRYGNRMFIEYVNRQGKDSGNFLRDLRGMIALESTMKQRGLKAEHFILVLRESLSTYLSTRPIYAKYELDIMPLSILLRYIERRELFSFYRNKASNEQMTSHAF